MNLKEFLKQSFKNKSDTRRITNNLSWCKSRGELDVVSAVSFVLQSAASLYESPVDYHSEEYNQVIIELIEDLKLKEIYEKL